MSIKTVCDQISTLYSERLQPTYGPFAGTDILCYRVVRNNMKCRPCDIGRFAGAITVDREYLLTPDGGISCSGLLRKYVHSTIMMFDTIDAAAEAVGQSWIQYGSKLPRDISDYYHDAPVGVVLRLELSGEDFWLKPVMALRDSSSQVISIGTLSDTLQRSKETIDGLNQARRLSREQLDMPMNI